MLDLNPSRIKGLVASDAINAAIDAAQVAEVREARNYLGASALGHDCIRKLLWDWRKPKSHQARTLRIFERGHWWEGATARLMLNAGFRILREGERTHFSQLGGRFRGHVDGIILDGPDIAGIGYPCLWEHKALGSKGWTKLQKEGIARAYPGYFVQCQIYMAYLDLTEAPAVFSAVNSDTAELLHLLVPFDVQVAQEWSDRALRVIQADENGETPPRISDRPDDWRCRFCSHATDCWSTP